MFDIFEVNLAEKRIKYNLELDRFLFFPSRLFCLMCERLDK